MARVLLALAGGVTGGALVWLIARRSLDQRLRDGSVALAAELSGGSRELEQRLQRGRLELGNTLKVEVNALVPPTVQREIQATLLSYGISPATGQRLDRALAAAERLGWL